MIAIVIYLAAIGGGYYWSGWQGAALAVFGILILIFMNLLRNGVFGGSRPPPKRKEFTKWDTDGVVRTDHGTL